MCADVVVKPEVRACSIDFSVPSPQLVHGNAIAQCNGLTLIARLDLVETIAVRGNPRHGWARGRIDSWGGWRGGG